METLYAENNFQPSTMEYSRVLGYSAACDMFINELVKINTDANTAVGEREKAGTDATRNTTYRYNYIYTKLAENLKKSIK